MRRRHSKDGLVDTTAPEQSHGSAAEHSQGSDGIVASATHAASDVGSGLRDAGGKLRDVTAKGAHDVAGAVRDATETAGHAAANAGHLAANAGGTVGDRAHAGAVALRTHRRRVGATTAALVAAGVAALAAVIARRKRS